MSLAVCRKGCCRGFTHAQHAWLDELLESMSAETLAKARERAHNIGVGAILLEARTGEVAQTIIGIAQEKQAEAIAVGRHSAGKISALLLLGSVSQKLVSLAPLPVTVVP